MLVRISLSWVNFNGVACGINFVNSESVIEVANLEDRRIFRAKGLLPVSKVEPVGESVDSTPPSTTSQTSPALPLSPETGLGEIVMPEITVEPLEDPAQEAERQARIAERLQEPEGTEVESSEGEKTAVETENPGRTQGNQGNEAPRTHVKRIEPRGGRGNKGKR